MRSFRCQFLLSLRVFAVIKKILLFILFLNSLIGIGVSLHFGPRYKRRGEGREFYLRGKNFRANILDASKIGAIHTKRTAYKKKKLEVIIIAIGFHEDLNVSNFAILDISDEYGAI